MHTTLSFVISFLMFSLGYIVARHRTEIHICHKCTSHVEYCNDHDHTLTGNGICMQCGGIQLSAISSQLSAQKRSGLKAQGS